MLTVLFVIVFLAASVGAISLLDGQRASREVTNYLPEEYHRGRDSQPTLAQLLTRYSSWVSLLPCGGGVFLLLLPP